MQIVLIIIFLVAMSRLMNLDISTLVHTSIICIIILNMTLVQDMTNMILMPIAILSIQMLALKYSPFWFMLMVTNDQLATANDDHLFTYEVMPIPIPSSFKTPNKPRAI